MSKITLTEMEQLKGGTDALFNCIGCGLGLISYGASIGAAASGVGIGIGWAIGHIATVLGTGIACATCARDLTS